LIIIVAKLTNKKIFIEKLSRKQMNATKGGFLFELFVVVACVACLFAGIWVGAQISL